MIPSGQLGKWARSLHSSGAPGWQWPLTVVYLLFQCPGVLALLSCLHWHWPPFRRADLSLLALAPFLWLLFLAVLLSFSPYCWWTPKCLRKAEIELHFSCCPHRRYQLNWDEKGGIDSKIERWSQHSLTSEPEWQEEKDTHFEFWVLNYSLEGWGDLFVCRVSMSFHL